MYNLLIIEDNTKYLRNFINIISDEIPKVKINHVSFGEENSFKILDKQSIDLILLDLKSSNLNSSNVLKYIDEHGLYKYKNSIIAISAELNVPYVLKYGSYLFSYHFENFNYDSIIESLRLLVDEKDNSLLLSNIKNKIHNELEFLNYNYSYIGTTYLEEAILELYKIRLDFDSFLSQNIYPIVARKNKEDVDTVFNNISQATNVMLKDCDESKLLEYLHYDKFSKPDANDIILTILNKL